MINALNNDVPTEHTNCCPCPEHWENYVGVAYKSYRLNLVDSNGLPFDRTETSCYVNVAGVYPSSAVGDAEIAFTRNGDIYHHQHRTVLGVAIKGHQFDLVPYNALNPDFGYPMTVCTNLWYAPQMRLVTNVKLPGGHVRLELANASGQFTVWYPDYHGGTYRKLLDTSSTRVKNLTMAYWKALMRRTTNGNTPELPIYITSSAPGTVTLKFRYWNVIDGKFVEDEAVQCITSVRPPLSLDYNQDGMLDALDVAASLGHRFYFWTNTDVWRDNDAFSSSFFDWVRGIVGSDNGDDDVVNGRNDLVNVLPVAICVEPFLSAWSGHNVKIVLRSCAADGVIRRCYSNLDWSSMDDGVSGDLDIDDESSWWNLFYEPKLHSAKMRVLERDGDMLSGDVAARAASERGAVFVEANADCFDPLEIAVKVDGAEMFSYRPSISFRDIDLMYRWHNIRDAAGEIGNDPTISAPDGGPTGLPDSSREDVDLFFVHGYNMNVKEARAWGRAFFKRLWWAGYKGRYHVVTWLGDEGQRWLPGEGLITPDYQKNVENAFVSAAALSNVVTSATGRKFVVAHSLGNMLVSAAAQDWGMTYERYFMMNAAVPVEAYDTNAVTAVTIASMTPSEWSEYEERLKSVNWRGQFSPSDARNGLTWSGRFSSVGNIVNYYSSEEEVLKDGSGNAPSPGREYAWYYQETHKGCKPYIPIYNMGRNEGGWGFNQFYDQTATEYNETLGQWIEWPVRMTPEQAAVVTNDLRVLPFFLPFEDSALHTTNVISQMSYAQRAQLLADAIPALSFAVGANPVESWDNDGADINVNMATRFKNTSALNRFTDADDDKKREWRHTFFLKVPYSVVKEFYKNLTNRAK